MSRDPFDESAAAVVQVEAYKGDTLGERWQKAVKEIDPSITLIFHEDEDGLLRVSDGEDFGTDDAKSGSFYFSKKVGEIEPDSLAGKQVIERIKKAKSERAVVVIAK